MDITKLQSELETLPDQIRTQENKVVEAEHELALAKLDYDVTTAHALLKSKRGNATEKKAEALIEAQFTKGVVIKNEYNLSKEQSAQNYLENKFISARKLSSLEEKHYQSNITGN